MKIFTIPNFITLANLISGCLGLYYVLGSGDLKTGSLCIVIALVLDFFDGFTARLLKVSSEIGKQLDSLADVVSFGVLPGFILFKMIEQAGGPEWLPYLSLLIPAFSALRLAKFNIDTRQAFGFIGLPTPANAIVIASFPFLTDQSVWVSQLINHYWFLTGYILLFSYLLICELPLPALKFKNYGWKDNQFSYLFLLISLVLLLTLHILAVPLIVAGYILYALFLMLRQ